MPYTDLRVKTRTPDSGAILYSSKRRPQRVIAYTTNGPVVQKWPATAAHDAIGWAFLTDMILTGWDARRSGVAILLTWVGDAHFGRG